MKRLIGRLRAGVVTILLLPLWVYRRIISPGLPSRCKYYPSCATYAEQAIRELGPFRGIIVAGWRLARCNPWSHGGYDPVEARRLFRDGSGPASGDPGTTSARTPGGATTA